MKIFIINTVFNVGSTGKIVYDTKEYYERCGHIVKVAYGIGGDVSEPDVIKYCTSAERYAVYFLWKFGYNEYKGASNTVKRIARAIEQFNPDIVHLHCLNSFCIDLYGLLNFLSSKDYKVVITHHAEFYYTGSCPHAYNCTNWIDKECNNCLLPNTHKVDLFKITPHTMWKRMYDAFSRFKPESLIFTAVSPWVKERADLSPITNRFKCITVLNGLDTTIFCHYVNSDEIIDKGKYKQIAFHATAAFSDNENNLKGGIYLIELAKKNPNILFIVAALYTNINNSLPSNIRLWGKAKGSDELAKLYSNADVTIICSKRETFSMVTAESLCCGTPVVGFKAGGPESISLKEYTRFVNYGDVQLLDEALHEIIQMGYNKQDISLKAISRYSMEEMSRNYLKVYDLLLG